MQILHLVSEVSLVSLTITTPPPPTLLSRCVCCTFPRVQRMLSKNDTEMSFVTKRFGAPLEVSKPQPLRSRGDAVLTHSLTLISPLTPHRCGRCRCSATTSTGAAKTCAVCFRCSGPGASASSLRTLHGVDDNGTANSGEALTRPLCSAVSPSGV